ncbi:NAD(P)H-dependent oxidoreductase [Bacillus sp. H-16]|uniref:NADPH-dependent FMN reductase n=1 Tax=Alteribacter salitolerans TaxID=2912333 RepID=UPI00196261A4|nr:NAD(P)H-dependent oxidoreductase [Alteribacter salitolerans]MBM7096047.1 NAD(P)H-dependent oxidoreductase [Alteribacter salitolerans]
MKIIGIAGSLRKESLNKVVLNEVKGLSGNKLDLEIVGIGDLPLFNGDLEEGGDPEIVKKFKDRIKQADGVFIVTPEYSRGMPGVLKNALDWAGSMTHENVLDKKTAAVIGASPGAQGTALAQVQVKQTLAACGSYVMSQPEVFIGSAYKRLGDNNVTDEKTIEILKDCIESFAEWTACF